MRPANRGWAGDPAEDCEGVVNHRRGCLDGNEAAARVAYELSELISIYPITPASPMAEHCDDWAAAGRPNLCGDVPSVVELQSERILAASESAVELLGQRRQ